MPGPHETIAQLWEKFEKLVIAPEAGAVQRKESRRVFYAAAHVTLVTTINISADLPEDEAMAKVSALMHECEAFGRAIQEGRA